MEGGHLGLLVLQPGGEARDEVSEKGRKICCYANSGLSDPDITHWGSCRIASRRSRWFAYRFPVASVAEESQQVEESKELGCLGRGAEAGRGKRPHYFLS